MASPMRNRAVLTSRTCTRGLLSFLRRSGTNQESGEKEKTKATTKPKQFADCPPRVFSGIQPTGIPHIGNYVGAIRNWVDLQHKFDSILLCVVDLHSITVPQDPKELRQSIFDMAACLIACGIDPEKSILFQQSTVLQHAELAWVLGCQCTLPRLEHLPQWKEKSQKCKEPGLGLFTYPVLQAADILLYKATDVPVGEDQIHHIELTRHLARSFNRKYSLVFPHCKATIGDVAKIRSLRNPEAKMSKSEADPLSRIELNDTPDKIAEKIKKAITDCSSEVTYEPENRPGVANLIDIHMAFSGEFAETICEDAYLKAMDTGMFKTRVTEVVVETLKPISDTILRLQQDKGYLEKVLKNGQQQAEVIAEQTMREVREGLGLR
ncbi:tryptophan--tRNA ligase, mitochondrial-like [Littorina saxatilis]|uniref:Tryptophan--tRNA ligase, mitochondrial n=1 Tax=Littorina saxatilis TaxID=31220 RepID=A0AAN9BQ96_9CAEN